MSIKSIIGKELDFFSDAERLSGIKENVEVYDNAQQQSVSAGQAVHIYVSNCDAADFRDATLRFTFNGIAGSGGTYSATPDGGIAGIINKIRVLFGSQLVYECIDYNLLMSFWSLSQGVQAYQTSLNVLMGTNESLSTRTSNFSNANRVWTVPIGKICNILDKVLPIGRISNQMHIEIWLEQPQNCLSSDQTGPSFSISNPQLHYKQLILTDEYKKALDAKLSSGVIQIPFVNYVNYITTIANTVTKQQNTLPWKYSRFISFFNINRDQVNISTQTYQTKFTNFLLYAQFVNSKARCNNKYYPADAVNGVTENYIQYLEAVDKNLNDDTNVGSNWSQYFNVSLSVTQYPKHLTENDESIQGLDISTSASTLIHEMILTGAPTLVQQDYFAQFMSLITIDGKGNLVYLE